MSYTLNEYQKDAERTIDHSWSTGKMMHHAAFGLCSEAGEVAGIFQKEYQGHELDVNHVAKEIGDALWFVAEMATAIGIPLEEIAQANIEKLRKRYPVKFDPDRSVNREKYGVTDEQMEVEKKYTCLMETKIEELDLGVRAYHALKNSGVNKVRDIIGWTKERLENTKPIGKKSYEEIINKLETIGIKYVDGTLTWRPEKFDSDMSVNREKYVFTDEQMEDSWETKACIVAD